jgi:ubiquinone biosynthesis protein COQ4
MSTAAIPVPTSASPASSRISGFFKAIRATFRLIVGMVRLAINPNNIDPIFRAGVFGDAKAVRLTVNRLESDPSIRAMINEGYLAREKYDIDALARLPEGTLGYSYARFIKHFDLKVDYAPPVDETKDSTLNYIRKRGRQTHDLWHVALGYRPDQLGEMKICAFYVRQIYSPLNALLLAVGLIVVVVRKPHAMHLLMDAIMTGWQDGAVAKRQLFGVRWEDNWARPIADLRAELGITVREEPWEQVTQAALETKAITELGLA